MCNAVSQLAVPTHSNSAHWTLRVLFEGLLLTVTAYPVRPPTVDHDDRRLRYLRAMDVPIPGVTLREGHNSRRSELRNYKYRPADQENCQLCYYTSPSSQRNYLAVTIIPFRSRNFTQHSSHASSARHRRPQLYGSGNSLTPQGCMYTGRSYSKRR